MMKSGAVVSKTSRKPVTSGKTRAGAPHGGERGSGKPGLFFERYQSPITRFTAGCQVSSSVSSRPPVDAGNAGRFSERLFFRRELTARLGNNRAAGSFKAERIHLRARRLPHARSARRAGLRTAI